MNLEWFSVLGAISRNREPDPEELAAALASGEEPPIQIREQIEELTDPNRQKGSGRPARWGEKDRIRWARLTLKCQLVDRVIQDRRVGKELGFDKAVPISHAFRWVEALSRQEVSEALRTSDLAKLLLKLNVKDSTKNGKTIEQHYYVWQHPSAGLLRHVHQRMTALLAKGIDEREAADEISNVGVYPNRSNKLRLPPGVIRSFYYRSNPSDDAV